MLPPIFLYKEDFMKIDMHIFDFDDDSEWDKISAIPCPSCQGKMTIGEEQVGGVCTDCYYKYSDHDSSTGE